MKKLSEAEINQRLEKLEGWQYEENSIQTKFEFENFKFCSLDFGNIGLWTFFIWKHLILNSFGFVHF